MAIHEGKWKCTYCGQVNQGRDVKCGQCGQVRGKDVKFFLDETAAEVTDKDLLGMAQAGADWTCAFCSTNNRATEGKCHQCGADRGTSPSLAEKVVGPGGAVQPGNASAVPVSLRARKSPFAVIAIVAGVIAAVVLVYFLFFSTSEKTAVLDRGAWQRTIPIEEHKWMEHTDWEGHVPANAVVLEQWREKYGTEKIQTGTERKKTGTRDKGNGFFEDVYQDVPVYTERDVYKNKIRYRIQEWVVTRTLKDEGDLARAPSWPAVTLSAAEREGTRRESAALYLRLGEKTYQYSVPVGELGTYKAGVKYKIWVTPLGAVTKIQAE
jgi:hypothetical protein